MDFHGEDDGSISWMQERLETLERQHQIWMEQYEGKKRRMEHDYAEKLAEIEETTARAAKELQLDYIAKKEAIINQFKPVNAHQHATDPQTVHAQPKPLLVTETAMQDVELFPNKSSVRTSCTEQNNLPVLKVVSEVSVDNSIVSSNEKCQREVEDAISDPKDYPSARTMPSVTRSTLPRDCSTSWHDLQSSTDVLPGSRNGKPILPLATGVLVPLPGNQTEISGLTMDETSDESKNDDGAYHRSSFSRLRVLLEDTHVWFDDVQLTSQFRRYYGLRHAILLPQNNSTCGTDDAKSAEQVGVTNSSLLLHAGALCAIDVSDRRHDVVTQSGLFDDGGVNVHSTGRRILLTTIVAVFDPGIGDSSERLASVTVLRKEIPQNKFSEYQLGRTEIVTSFTGGGMLRRFSAENLSTLKLATLDVTRSIG